MKQSRRLAWVSAAIAALAIGFGASTAGAYKRHTEPGASCQPYWRDAETIHARSAGGSQTNSADSDRFMVCPVRVEASDNRVSTVHARVWASTGVGCYLLRNNRSTWHYSPIDYNRGSGYLLAQLDGSFAQHSWQLMCLVPIGGHITSYTITTP